MDLGLKDRVAIITGGSRGIGKACAKELLAEGACVVLVSKDAAVNAAAVRELGKLHPDRVLGVAADLTDDAAIAAMTAQAVEQFGRIDILVNAAATVIPQDFFKMADGELTVAARAEIQSRRALPSVTPCRTCANENGAASSISPGSPGGSRITPWCPPR